MAQFHTATGGGVAGGSASQSSTYLGSPTIAAIGGAIGGGAAATETLRQPKFSTLRWRGGAIAGGAATVFPRLITTFQATAGGLCGGASSVITAVVAIASGGGIAGGAATSWTTTDPVTATTPTPLVVFPARRRQFVFRPPALGDR